MPDRKPLILLFLLLVAGCALDGLWLEPRHLLLRDEVHLDLRPPTRWNQPAAALRIVHFSDLHVRTETPALRRLLASVRLDEPDWIAISGDVISNSSRETVWRARTATAAALVAELRRLAPVVAVQGHSEYQGEVVEALGRAGIEWLSNEGIELRPGGPVLLGLNQQVGWEALPRPDGRLHLAAQRSFELREDSKEGGFVAAVREGPRDNLYLHWDPHQDLPSGGSGPHLARTDGPLTWSGYELRCELRIDRPSAGAGVTVHSRFVAGEDRMLRLRRIAGGRSEPASFVLVPHGTAFTAGETDTGVVPEPRRWYRVRVRTEVEERSSDGAVRIRAKVWPADGEEPADWQAWAEDRSATQVTSGTVGLWAWEEGGASFRDVQVIARPGEAGERVLLEEPFRTEDAPGSRLPPGWREGARASRLELALARSPEAAPNTVSGTPRLVLSHTPGVVLEAAHRGLEAVLAGHTHGGQVRLPFLGALTTRSFLGPHYDRGVFHFGSPSARGLTTLHVSSGVGTSLVPVRFFDPPRYAVIQVFSDSAQPAQQVRPAR